MDTQLILLCGRHQEAARELRAMPHRVPMLVEGFTREVPYYMALADYFIGKPGPGCLSEALAMQLPAIVERNAWTLAHERYNADWLLEQGAGLVIGSFSGIAGAVRQLLSPDEYPRYRQRAAATRNTAVFEIPELLDGILRRRAAPPPPCPRNSCRARRPCTYDNKERGVNLALIGLGFMGATHLEALRRTPEVRVAGVVTRDARKLRGRSAVPDAGSRAGRSGDRCGGHLPAHPPARRVAIDALRAGKHVLVEKPMALDSPSAADAMAAEAERQGRILMIAHVLRFWPAYVALREAVRGNQFGRVRHARFERRSAVPGWGPWLLDPALSGGGAFDLLIHDVDMCLHLFGRPSAVAAVRYAELLDAQLYYPDMVAHISGGWQHAGAFPFRMEYTVTFEGATAEYSSIGRPATLYSAEETRPLEQRGDAAGDPRGRFLCRRDRLFRGLLPYRSRARALPAARIGGRRRTRAAPVAGGRRNGEKIECTI